MAIAADASVSSVAWWKEPTKDQWFAWTAAWLGWMLDAFDFTIFLFIMVPIAREFGVSVTAVAVSRITHFEGQVIALFDGLPAGTSRAL